MIPRVGSNSAISKSTNVDGIPKDVDIKKMFRNITAEREKAESLNGRATPQTVADSPIPPSVLPLPPPPPHK